MSAELGGPWRGVALLSAERRPGRCTGGAPLGLAGLAGRAPVKSGPALTLGRRVATEAEAPGRQAAAAPAERYAGRHAPPPTPPRRVTGRHAGGATVERTLLGRQCAWSNRTGPSSGFRRPGAGAPTCAPRCPPFPTFRGRRKGQTRDGMLLGLQH